MNIGVIFAGGVGQRMHTKGLPKQFLSIYNKPIIVHTLEIFEKVECIDAIVVSCVEEWIPRLQDLVYQFRLDKVKRIVPGGTSGQLSIYNGLVAAADITDGEDAIVLIHDGVRPLIDAELLNRNIEDVKKFGSSITSAVVKETIVEVDESGTISSVPNRAHARVARAPQCFELNDILAVHKKSLAKGKTDFVDSCTMMQAYGRQLHMTTGPFENIKVTTPDDFYTMRAIIEAKENAQIYGL